MSRFRFVTGSYTTGDLFPGSRGQGIQLWELDSASGAIAPLSTFSELSSPSWLSVHPSGPLLAAGSEHADGASRVALLRLSSSGSYQLLDTTPSGDATCHVAFSPDGRYLASAAYMSGEVQLMLVGDDGFSGAAQRYRYQGSGPNLLRQQTPHAHQVSFSPDGRLLFVPDLGSDRICCHRIDNGTLSAPISSLALPGGEGPRHIAFDWQHSLAFVIAELSGRVHSFSVDPQSGACTWLHSISSLPDDFHGTPSAAAIRLHPHKPFLYVSNRNAGLLSTFLLNPSTISLALVATSSLQDPCPRDFNISPDGRWLLVAGQLSHHLYAHPIQPTSGHIAPATHSTPCPSPVCVQWLAEGAEGGRG